MNENEILPVEQLSIFEIANFLYRYFNNFLPSVFEHNFDQNILKSNTGTRKTKNGSNVFPKYSPLGA